MRNKLITIALLFALTITGCGSTDYTRDNYTSIVAVNAVLTERTKKVDETIVKVDRKDCQHCKGTGILISGDGITRETCPFCEVKKGAYVEEKPVVQVPTVSDRCCPDCICGDKCNCKYAGECLISKNNGWAVQICDENECRVYLPEDTVGTKYNPYNLLTPAQKNDKAYQKYKYPIKINALGEEITPPSTSAAPAAAKRTIVYGCPSCRI